MIIKLSLMKIDIWLKWLKKVTFCIRVGMRFDVWWRLLCSNCVDRGWKAFTQSSGPRGSTCRPRRCISTWGMMCSLNEGLIGQSWFNKSSLSQNDDHMVIGRFYFWFASLVSVCVDVVLVWKFTSYFTGFSHAFTCALLSTSHMFYREIPCILFIILTARDQKLKCQNWYLGKEISKTRIELIFLLRCCDVRWEFQSWKMTTTLIVC